MKKSIEIPLWSAILTHIFAIVVISVLVIQLNKLTEKNRELQKQRDILQTQQDVVNQASVYKIDNPSPRPLWPMPGFDRKAVYHLVMEVFQLEGSGLPHQVHMLKNVESGIIEVGIFEQTRGFHQGAIIETRVGQTQVLSTAEADEVLRKFGRKK